jgi:uncharacterized membrane protein
MSNEPRLLRVRKQVSTSWKGVVITVIVAILTTVGGWVAGQLTYGLILAMVIAVVGALMSSRASTQKMEVVQTFGVSHGADVALKKPDMTAGFGIGVVLKQEDSSPSRDKE